MTSRQHRWPTCGPQDGEWHRLRTRDRLDEVDGGLLAVTGGLAEIELVVAMPGIARLRLRPEAGAGDVGLTGR